MGKYVCILDGHERHEVDTTSARSMLYRYRARHAVIYNKSGKILSEAKREDNGNIVYGKMIDRE